MNTMVLVLAVGWLSIEMGVNSQGAMFSGTDTFSTLNPVCTGVQLMRPAPPAS